MIKNNKNWYLHFKSYFPIVCTHYNHRSSQGALSRGAGLTLALYLEGSFMVKVAYTPRRYTDF